MYSILLKKNASDHEVPSHFGYKNKRLRIIFLLIIVPTIWKMGTNFVFGCALFFFYAKSATTNNHRRELSDLSF